MKRHEQLTVLQSCSSPSWGGLEMQALQECLQLAKRSHRVILVCHPNSPLECAARARGIKTIPLILRDFPGLVGILRTRSALLRDSVDVVHAQLSKDLWCLVPAVKLSRKHIPILLTKRVGSFIRKKDPLHRWIYKNIDCAIAISTVIKTNLLETCPISAERLKVVHDGVDLEFFSLEENDPRSVREEFNIKPTDLLLGMIGRFTPGKGHEDFLEALGLLRSRFPNLRALIVGEGSFGEHAYELEIRRLAKESDLQGVVTFTGFRNDVPAILASLDVLVFPSHAEAFGDVVIEAMAMAKPVVSTNCDGVLDIVVHGETGLQVPPRDPPHLAEAIAALINDPDARRRYGEAGLNRVRNHFDLEGRTSLMISTYTDLLRMKQQG